MRIDKYIWAIRIVKTRSIANSLCRDGKVEIGGKKVKSAREINPGDTIVIRKRAVFFSYKVIDIPKSRVCAALVTDYAEDVTPKKQLDKLEMIRLANVDRPKGLGRPTKRDRRNWEKSLGYD